MQVQLLTESVAALRRKLDKERKDHEGTRRGMEEAVRGLAEERAKGDEKRREVPTPNPRL